MRFIFTICLVFALGKTAYSQADSTMVSSEWKFNIGLLQRNVSLRESGYIERHVHRYLYAKDSVTRTLTQNAWKPMIWTQILDSAQCGFAPGDTAKNDFYFRGVGSYTGTIRVQVDLATTGHFELRGLMFKTSIAQTIAEAVTVGDTAFVDGSHAHVDVGTNSSGYLISNFHFDVEPADTVGQGYVRIRFDVYTTSANGRIDAGTQTPRSTPLNWHPTGASLLIRYEGYD